MAFRLRCALIWAVTLQRQTNTIKYLERIAVKGVDRNGRKKKQHAYGFVSHVIDKKYE